MPYTEGAHDSPADTKDRLVRVGSKYQSTPDTVNDGDNVYQRLDDRGNHGSFIVDKGGNTAAQIVNSNSEGRASSEDGLTTQANLWIKAPDGLRDLLRSAGDSAPSQGALNVALIGGNLTLRASAVAGEASGTSTAVDNLGWVKGFNCHLDVTAAPTGGSPTLDTYLQTQLASGDWQDIAHFTQATGVTAEIVDWGPADGNFSGIGAEGAAVTYDRFFAEQDGALGAATIRLMNLGDSMRVKWVFAAGGSSGDFTFAVTMTPHS